MDPSGHLPFYTVQLDRETLQFKYTFYPDEKKIAILESLGGMAYPWGTDIVKAGEKYVIGDLLSLGKRRVVFFDFNDVKADTADYISNISGTISLVDNLLQLGSKLGKVASVISAIFGSDSLKDAVFSKDPEISQIIYYQWREYLTDVSSENVLLGRYALFYTRTQMLIDEELLIYNVNRCGDVIESSITITDPKRYSDLIMESGLTAHNILEAFK